MQDFDSRPATVAESCRIVGISRQRVTTLRHNGQITGTTLAEWIGSYCANLREKAAGRDPGDGALNLTQERAALAEAQRKRLERAARVAERELIPAHDVLMSWSAQVGAARARLLALPIKIAYRIAPPGKTAEAQALAQEAVYEALNELAGDGLPTEATTRGAGRPK